METTAKYRLMGAFTLAAILGVFAFVFWLNHGGGLGERSVYRIKFLGPVPGLRPGAAVQFNGIRVGEVTDLQLDATTPQQVMATISIDRSTPVRADTQVSLDFQGLMGVTSIALRGGAPQSQALAGSGGSPPLLVADAGAGADLTTTAREALRRLDGILAENADSLRGTFSSLNIFTSALAKNSNRIDSIVAGLERMTGGDSSKALAQSFDLTAPRSFPPSSTTFKGQIAVVEPTSLIVFDSQKFIVRDEAGSRTQLAGGAQWVDNLPKVVQARIVQTLENAISPAAIARATDNLAADRQLLLDIRQFELVKAEHPIATIEITARIVGEGARVLDARTFSATATASSNEAAAAATAFNQAFTQVASDLAVWAKSISQQ